MFCGLHETPVVVSNAMRPCDLRPQPSRRIFTIQSLAFWVMILAQTTCKARPSVQMIWRYLHSPRSGWKGWLHLGQTRYPEVCLKRISAMRLQIQSKKT